MDRPGGRGGCLVRTGLEELQQGEEGAEAWAGVLPVPPGQSLYSL